MNHTAGHGRTSCLSKSVIKIKTPCLPTHVMYRLMYLLLLTLVATTNHCWHFYSTKKPWKKKVPNTRMYAWADWWQTIKKTYMTDHKNNQHAIPHSWMSIHQSIHDKCGTQMECSLLIILWSNWECIVCTSVCGLDKNRSRNNEIKSCNNGFVLIYTRNTNTYS